MIYAFIYFLIGCLLTYYWWTKLYSEKYEITKANNNVEEPMVHIFLILLIFFWPIKLFYQLFKLLTNK